MISDGIENWFYSMFKLQSREVKEPFRILHTNYLLRSFCVEYKKEKKQTHVKNKVIEKTDHQSWTTMTYDDRSITFLTRLIVENLPDEDVYKPKNKKPEEKKKVGLEHFMDEGETDAVRGYD